MACRLAGAKPLSEPIPEKLTSGSERGFLGKFICKMFRFRNPFHKHKEREFLKSFDSFQTIARATRKALFRYKIWKPKHDRTPVIVANRRKQPTLSLQRGVPRMRSDKVNKEVIVKPKENTVPVIIGNRKLPSRSKWRGTSKFIINSGNSGWDSWRQAWRRTYKGLYCQYSVN